MQHTTNHGLNLPESADFFSVQHHNANMDLIDDALAGKADQDGVYTKEQTEERLANKLDMEPHDISEQDVIAVGKQGVGGWYWGLNCVNAPGDNYWRYEVIPYRWAGHATILAYPFYGGEAAYIRTLNNETDGQWLRVATENDLENKANSSHGILKELDLLEWAKAQSVSGAFFAFPGVSSVPRKAYFAGWLDVNWVNDTWSIRLTDVVNGDVFNNCTNSTGTIWTGWVQLATVADLDQKVDKRTGYGESVSPAVPSKDCDQIITTGSFRGTSETQNSFSKQQNIPGLGEIIVSWMWDQFSAFQLSSSHHNLGFRRKFEGAWEQWQTLATAKPPQEYDLKLESSTLSVYYPCRYSKSQDCKVLMNLSLKTKVNTPPGTPIAVLPVGFRPAYNIEIPIVVKGGAGTVTSSAVIYTNGQMTLWTEGGEEISAGALLFFPSISYIAVS